MAARITLLYVGLALFLAYPLTAHPASRVVSTSPDTDLFLWMLEWDAHAFVHRPFSIFDANIYYPERGTLAYSENLIGSAVFAAPVLWLTDNPVLAMNLVALLSCVLCGLGAYVLARSVGIGAPGATLSGIIFAFSPPRFLRLDQMHLITIQWVPFTLAALHTYLHNGQKARLRLATACFTLQALTSGHGAVFLTVAMVCLISYRTVLGEPIAARTWLRHLGWSGMLLLAPAVLIMFPYRSVQLEMGLRRSLENWAIPSSSFLASPTYVQTYLLSLVPDARINETAGAYLFPGFLPLVLAAAAVLAPIGAPLRAIGLRGTTRTRVILALDLALLTFAAAGVLVAAQGSLRVRIGTLLLSARSPWRAWLLGFACVALRLAISPPARFDIRPRLRRWLNACQAWAKRRRQDMTTFYLLLTIVSVWLSVGPPIGLWAFVYWLPGLNFIRVPARFTLLALLALSVLAGFGFDKISARLAPRARLSLAVILGTLLVAEFTAPLGTDSYRVEIPAIDKWLAGQSTPFAVAEVPLADPRDLGAWERRQTAYMLHSTAHWQKTIHGYSGLRPARHVQLYTELTAFPDEKSLTSLTELGLDYVVVHTDWYSPSEWAIIQERIGRYPASLKLTHVEGAGRVYSLLRPSGK